LSVVRGQLLNQNFSNSLDGHKTTDHGQLTTDNGQRTKKMDNGRSAVAHHMQLTVFRAAGDFLSLGRSAHVVGRHALESSGAEKPGQAASKVNSRRQIEVLA
jgi:hypothetical protein